MPAVVLFGATGYTGRLTAHALARRGVDFSIVGRDRSKLEALAADTGGPSISIAGVGDVDGLVRALDGAHVLVTCVGPFAELGDTAVEAALRAGCNYIDSTGEISFVVKLVEQHSEDAIARGIMMIPSFGFDEVPADVAISLACEGLELPDAVLTYATSRVVSTGTMKSILGVIASGGYWIEEGRAVSMRLGQATRWAPMPPPLGVRMSVAAPLAIARIAPLHIDLRSLETYAITGRMQQLGLRAAMPVARHVAGTDWVRALTKRATELLPEGPGASSRTARWTVLAEAHTSSDWRNVVVTGRDVYGLTGELLAAGAAILAAEEDSLTGVVSPVQAVGLERLQKEMIDLGVEIETYEPG
jgi:short subunit dehydrogenase-like uncharacterized protein